MHENYDYYKKCKYRYRNKGLFTADQVYDNLSNNTVSPPPPHFNTVFYNNFITQSVKH